MTKGTLCQVQGCLFVHITTGGYFVHLCSISKGQRYTALRGERRRTSSTWQAGGLQDTRYHKICGSIWLFQIPDSQTNVFVTDELSQPQNLSNVS